MKFSMLFLFVSLAAFPQERPEGPPPGAHHAPAPKNLKILPPEHLMETMRAFTVALGVKCDFCHAQGDFASDEKHNKEVARMMLTMSHEINAKFPDGKMHVTCYTCHRGAEEPATHPAAAEQGE